MIKVLITDKLAQEGIDLLNSTEGVDAVIKTGISEEELAGIIGEHDGLIIRSGTKVTAKVLSRPGKLRAVARADVGVDNIADVLKMTPFSRVVKSQNSSENHLFDELTNTVIFGI